MTGRMEMKQLATMLVSLALTGAAPAYGGGMQISPNGSQPALRGAPENFTGSVVVQPLFAADDGMRSSGGLVTFAPGARSAWHAHPAGQILIVTSGTGWTQEEGGEKREIKPGDVIWTPPGVKHWHGATTANGMSHIAITNVADGKTVVWMEQVSDEQYRD
jgi:quercetin dioxygenase-like cupin family protein